MKQFVGTSTLCAKDITVDANMGVRGERNICPFGLLFFTVRALIYLKFQQLKFLVNRLNHTKKLCFQFFDYEGHDP